MAAFDQSRVRRRDGALAWVAAKVTAVTGTGRTLRFAVQYAGALGGPGRVWVWVGVLWGDVIWIELS